LHRHLILIIAVLLGFGQLFRMQGCTLIDFRPKSTGVITSAIDIYSEPLQEKIEESESQPILKEVQGVHVMMTPVARYSISGRVVSVKHYYMDWPNRLAPVDLAIAWGKLASHDYDRQIAYDHGNRFYHYRYKSDFPLGVNYIVTHSANNHLIPATPTIEKLLKSIRADEQIQINGYLVNVTGPQGFAWNSSLTREDSGGGACELIYVKEVRIGRLKWE
jgi:hypothetical protein